MTQATSSGDTGQRAIIVIAALGGLLVVPTLAQINPTIVNGFLILVLVGIVLGNANRWLPAVTSIHQSSGSGSVAGNGPAPGGLVGAGG